MTKGVSVPKEFTVSNVAIFPTSKISNIISPKRLFKRPDKMLDSVSIALVMLDLEWNCQSEVISLGAFHPGSGLEFETLIRQRTAGLTRIHGITAEMLKDKPTILHVLMEFFEFLKCINAKKTLLVAHYGLGADFPKLFKAIHSIGIRADTELECADSRYVFKKAFDLKILKKGKGKIPMSLSKLFQLYKPNETYEEHRSLADSKALYEVLFGLIPCIKKNSSPESVYNHIVWCQPSEAKAKFYSMIHPHNNGIPENYMAVSNDLWNTGGLLSETKKQKTVNRGTKRRRIETEEENIEENSFSYTLQRQSQRVRERIELDQMTLEELDELNDDNCYICDAEEANETSPLLECDGCSNSCHLRCIVPVLHEVPSGDWYCQQCHSNPSMKYVIDSELQDDEYSDG